MSIKTHKKTILIAGGAGYIGSHLSYVLAQSGYAVIVLDKLIYQKKAHFPWAQFIFGDYGNKQLLTEIFSLTSIDAVVFTGGLSVIDNSIADPESYYRHNCQHILTLLAVMRRFGCFRFITTSHYAVYGAANDYNSVQYDSINFAKLSPLGKAASMVELLLPDYATAYGLSFMVFRPSVVAGAFPEAQLGDRRLIASTTLLALVRAVYTQQPVEIIKNLPTPDGTLMRDYIHVRDVAVFYRHAIDRMFEEGHLYSEVIPLASGTQYSLLQVINELEKLTNKKVICRYKDVDAPEKIAAQQQVPLDKASSVLHYSPRYSTLRFILQSILQDVKAYLS